MLIKVPAHEYEVQNLGSAETQTIRFIKKRRISSDDARLITEVDGTTNEEILKVLIDRLKGLSAILPSRENSVALTKLEEALMWLEKRTADRVARGVENTSLK